ncbi:MAG: Anaphase-promoting complex subunit 1 [Chrysothrix sp. TS-e1954]|nr:MAG: Anaphase-promoting complex subunit 1 [Chrysothrix sp. TS-e1954]
MAYVTHLGEYVPSGLRLLVAEHILPSEPSPTLYKWQVYEDAEGSREGEELVVTDHAVVWSQGGINRRLLRFQDGEQLVQHALLTWFDDPQQESYQNERKGDAYDTPSSEERQHPKQEKLRALVVFFKRQVEIFFRGGIAHRVSLPFELEKAFSLPVGCLLQRKLSSLEARPPSPFVPSAPPNSFWASQNRGPISPTSNFRSSRTPNILQPSKVNLPTSLDDFKLSQDPPNTHERLPRLFALTDPVSEVTPVTNLDPLGRGYNVQDDVTMIRNDKEEVHHLEDVLYVSTKNEMKDTNNASPLLLLVTFNTLSARYTIWYVLYTNSRPRSRSIQEDIENTASRRRSGRQSGFHQRISTGAGTPVLRRSEGLGDSMRGVQQSTLVGNVQTSQTGASETFLNNGDHERLLNSQLEDDQALTERGGSFNRRTSSRIARAELSSQDPQVSRSSQASNAGPYTRRKQHATRNAVKFGHETSRISARDSVNTNNGRLSDVDEDMQDDVSSNSKIDQILLNSRPPRNRRRLRNLAENTSSEVHLIQVASETASVTPSNDPGQSMKVVVEISSRPTDIPEESGPCVRIFLLNQDRQFMREMYLPLRTVEIPHDRRVSGEEQDDIPRVAVIPSSRNSSFDHEDIVDVAKVIDGSHCRVLTVYKPSEGCYCLRFFDCLKRLTLDCNSSARKDLGDPVYGIRKISGGFNGRLYAADSSDRRSAMQIRLLPRTTLVFDSLELLANLFPGPSPHGPDAFTAWWTIQNEVYTSESDALAILLIATIIKAPKAQPTESFLQFDKFVNDLDHNVQVPQGQWKNEKAWQWSVGSDQSSVSLFRSGSNSKDRVNDFYDLRMHIRLAMKLCEDHSRYTGQWMEYWEPSQDRCRSLQRLVLGVHLLHEEQRLGVSRSAPKKSHIDISGCLVNIAKACDPDFSLPLPSVLAWLNERLSREHDHPFAGIEALAQDSKDTQGHRPISKITGELGGRWQALTPRTTMLERLLAAWRPQYDSSDSEDLPTHYTADAGVLEIFTCALRNAHCFHTNKSEAGIKTLSRTADPYSTSGSNVRGRRDVRTICNDTSGKTRLRQIDERAHEASERLADSTRKNPANTEDALMRQIFKDNRRWHEAERLLDPLKVAVAESIPQPLMTEAAFLEGQKVLAQKIYSRTMALPSGQGAMMFGTYKPILTERIHTSGFNTGCTMQPSGNVVSAEKQHFTEEKVSWAFFHAGVNAGLRISQDSMMIDNSWIVLNKPNELGNRHAGLLLALGLSGHLKNMAKWLAFKYLSQKHNMTSVGLLIGFSASHLGTMDSMVTRLLSVHITRLLPPGAAELNLSPLTQTAGVMGIGLLYYNSKHRRMTEVLLSEVEHLDEEDNRELHQNHRDEGYRLAAGFAVGFINLGKGRDPRLLHNMKATERLLAVATAPKEVDTVHILDQASAGATIAIALIYLKSNNDTVASKINIPSSTRQFSYIRPDVLLLRTVARHLIMWDSIGKDFAWVHSSLPQQFRGSPRMDVKAVFRAAMLPDAPSAGSLAFYNISAGICWSIALRHAGTGDETAWATLSFYFDQIRPVINTTYATFDKSLARDSLMRFQHLLALGMATIMAGNGHLPTLQRLRTLHGVVEDKSFGYHQAAHMAIGVLFLGRGRFTFGTNDLAVASLLCAFYPIFPKDTLDNRAHLQAFRHFWTFAAEPRCLLLRDAETSESLVAPAQVTLIGGSQMTLEAPALLPELDKVATLYINATGYWPVRIHVCLDSDQSKAFRKSQVVLLKRKPLLAQHPSTLAATFTGLADRVSPVRLRPFEWIFTLRALEEEGANYGDIDEILPDRADDQERTASGVRPLQTLLDLRTTAIDDSLMLSKAARGSKDDSAIQEVKSVLASAKGMLEGEQLMNMVRASPWLKEERVQKLRGEVAKQIT